MPTLVFASELPCPVERLWAFHASAAALERLAPPGTRIAVEGDAPVVTGAVHRITLRRFGVPVRWIARIERAEPPTAEHAGGFVDVAERSPFAAWRHEHRFEPTPTGSRLIDVVAYTPPFGAFGRLLDRLVLRREIERLFAFRHAATRAALV